MIMALISHVAKLASLASAPYLYRITDIDARRVYEALGFRRGPAHAIREEAINVLPPPSRDGDEPRIELTYNHGVRTTRARQPPTATSALSARRLDGTLERIAAQGDRPERPAYSLREGGLAPSVFVRDPDGYRCGLIERARVVARPPRTSRHVRRADWLMLAAHESDYDLPYPRFIGGGHVGRGNVQTAKDGYAAFGRGTWPGILIAAHR